MDRLKWNIRFKGYLPVDDQMEERLRRVIADLDKLPASAIEVDERKGVITIDYSRVKGWLEASRQIVHTVRVGEHLVVKPPWEECEMQPGDVVLEVDPGTSFGSGLHESTRLCLQALEKYLKPGQTVVDFGTGSGILAIAAAKLGASHVTAIEADPVAVKAARSNVERNGLADVVEVRHGRSPSCAPSKADLVTANITAETISANLSALAGILKVGGMLIASGMTKRNAKDVERILPTNRFNAVEKLVDGQWTAIVTVLAGDT